MKRFWKLQASKLQDIAQLGQDTREICIMHAFVTQPPQTQTHPTSRRNFGIIPGESIIAYRKRVLEEHAKWTGGEVLSFGDFWDKFGQNHPPLTFKSEEFFQLEIPYIPLKEASLASSDSGCEDENLGRRRARNINHSGWIQEHTDQLRSGHILWNIHPMPHNNSPN